MQSVWPRKGNVKKQAACNSTDRPTLDQQPSAAEFDTNESARNYCDTNVLDTRNFKYSDFRFRREEKFLVLPRIVRAHIETVLLAWLMKSPQTRLCLGDVLGMSLTVLAHASHHISLRWERFLNARLDDDVLLRVIRCYKTSVPEPGTYVGEIVAQFFQHCKQQSNLNVKRTIGQVQTSEDQRPDRGEETSSATTDCQPQPGITPKDMPTTDSNHAKAAAAAASKRSDIDRKFEIIMSLKRIPRVTIMFRTLQNVPFRKGGAVLPSADQQEENELLAYLAKRVFGTLCFADGKGHLEKLQHKFAIHQFTNTAGGEIYFSLEIFRNGKYDLVLDRVFESVHLFNQSLTKVEHRLGECNVVYCSDTLYFIDMSKSLFIDNSVTFIYCFLTNKDKPIIESKEETDAFGLAKILSSVEYSTKCSLKRNHNSKMGHGPLTSVISEGGLNESAKYVNNMIRSNILCSDTNTIDGPNYRLDNELELDPFPAYVPTSPTYAPTSPAPLEDITAATATTDQTASAANDWCTGVDDDPSSPVVESDGASSKCIDGTYVINEPYVNTFLNRPVECGNMY